MAGSFEVNGDEATVTFTYTANTTKVQSTLERAAKEIYGGSKPNETGEFISFDDLTNQEKIDVIDSWIRSRILGMARRDLQKEYDALLNSDDTIDL